ncbi:MAG: serine/threonine protein phosphatase [Ruminococcaceae bacterium]|nr:serine/threonine protein phosphatase [Oscillospiraceae bacterium]
MALFAIGDPHLSLDGSKPMTVFSGWDNHVERLEKNWRNVVSPEDTVVIPGDLSWAMSLEQAREDFAFLHRLPGQKLILKGNHDYWWCTRRKMEAFFEEQGFTSLHFVHNDAVPVDGTMAVCGTRGWFFDAEEDADRKVLLREVGRLRTSIRAAKSTGLEPIAFLHYPPLYAGQTCPELIAVLLEEGIKRCYYGHIHSYGIRQAFNGVADGIEYRLISADALSFCPQRIFPTL